MHGSGGKAHSHGNKEARDSSDICDICDDDGHGTTGRAAHSDVKAQVARRHACV